MIKRSILIENKSSITCKNLQLIIETETRKSSIPIEDIGFVVIDNRETYISIPALSLLAENNSAVIFCNQLHLPSAMLLSLDSHHVQHQIFKQQIDASMPLKKQMWQQVIIEKIKNQGLLLEKSTQEKNNFELIANRVLSGDTGNQEGIAAAIYWKKIFEVKFKRERFGEYPNNFLNYGYALLRAATARALAGSGLLNTLGIHHRNKYNSFALADDIMEPYRPLIDEKVIELMQRFESDELNTTIKAELLTVLTRTVFWETEKSPFMVALQKTANSVQQCFTGETKKVKYAKLWS
jgi:CRISPR-associated protein Cas1